MNNQTETTKPKKANTGKIGFILTFAAPLSMVVPLIIIFLIPSPVALLLFIAPPVLFLLSVVYCTHGLFKKRSPKLATTGLIINALIIVILFLLLIGLTPPGTMPYPLNLYKFKRTCPKAAFWLDFNKEHIERIQSQYAFLILGSAGTIHFTSSPNAYTTQQVIQYAEANGWKYHISIPASKFQDFLNANEDDLSIEEFFFRYKITSIRPLTILMEPNDSVLIFETENYLGHPSLAVLSEKGDELRVYYNNQARPDPAEDFSLPQSFYEFNENNNEVDHED
ncbi:MAG: hypothetical protein ISS71_03400 [Phycisphaerae bacterium]|nr:hypothetical protein [Phycisphaerae bacterium]